MKKTAIGLIELLIVAILIVVICILYFGPNSKRENPFEQQKRVNAQKQIVEDKIQEIENTNKLRQKIENNLNGDY